MRILLPLLLAIDSVHGLAKGFGATTPKPYTTDNSPAIQSLLQTLQTNRRTDVSNVEIGEGRGLFATKNFQPGQIVCKIPSDFGIALGEPKQTPTVAHCGANLVPFLTDANWKFYIDTLPKSIESPTPDLWSDEDIALLEYEEIMDLARERRENIASVAQERGLSLEQLQYATWLVSSRSFSIAMAEEDVKYDEKGQVMAKAGAQQRIRVLVPVLDFVNFANNPNVRLTLIDPEKDEAWFALEATRKISKHSELTMTYGLGLSSVALLGDYGFVPGKTFDIDKLLLQKKEKKPSWTTTLEDDEAVLDIAKDEKDTERLRLILNFRLRLKEAQKALES